MALQVASSQLAIKLKNDITAWSARGPRSRWKSTCLNMFAAKIMKTYLKNQKIQKMTKKHWHFWIWFAAKIMKTYKKYKKIQNMTKTLTFLNMIAAKIMNNNKKNKKWQNMTNTLTFLNMIAATIIKINKNTKKDKTWQKNIDMFEYDCSENNEHL